MDLTMQQLRLYYINCGRQSKLSFQHILRREGASLSIFHDRIFTSQAGGGVFKVKFIRYKNPGGIDENGVACDRSAWSSYRRACDTYFYIIFRHGGQESEPFETHHMGNKNSEEFGDNIIGTPNPLKVKFTKFKGPLEYEIQVWDEDVGRDERIETLSGKIFFNENNKWQMINATNSRRRSFLTFKAMVICDSNDGDCLPKSRRTSTNVASASPSSYEKTEFWTVSSTISTESKSTEKSSSASNEKTSGKSLQFSIIIPVVVLVALLLFILPLSVFIIKRRRKSRSSSNAQELDDQDDNQNGSQINSRFKDLLKDANQADVESTVNRNVEAAEASPVDDIDSHVYADPSKEKKASRRAVKGVKYVPVDDVDSHIYADPSMEKKRSLNIIYADLDFQDGNSGKGKPDIVPKLETSSVENKGCERKSSSSSTTKGTNLGNQTDTCNNSQIKSIPSDATTEQNTVYLEIQDCRVIEESEVSEMDDAASHVYADPSMEKKKSKKETFV